MALHATSITKASALGEEFASEEHILYSFSVETLMTLPAAENASLLPR